jgi:radical SAM protein with 4Fe4S-binding SPASM domain
MNSGRRALARSFLPATAVLELTRACNHRCLYCSCPWEADGAAPRQPELSLAGWRACVEKLTAMGVTSLAFTGGEPLLVHGLEELIAFAAACRAEHTETRDGQLVTREGPPSLILISNGRAMTREVLELCHRHEVHLSLSLPGLSTYAAHTQSDTSPASILRWFGEARARAVETTVNVTVTRRNLFELYETIGEALLAGAGNVLLNRFLPGGRGLRHVAELSLDADGIAEMLETAEAVLAAAGRPGSLGTELPRCRVGERRFERLRVGTTCAAAVAFFVIGPSGHARVCNHSPIDLVHVSELERLKANDYWRRFVFKRYLPAGCNGCVERARCDGGCREASHVVFGQPDSPDPLLAAP